MRKFTARLKEEEFEIDGKKYIMKEMNGTLRDDYNQAMADRLAKGPDGKPQGFKTIKGMDSDLFTRCVVDSETENFVDKATVESWPSSMIDDLSDWALEFNGLNKKAEDKAKNDSPESDGSGGE